VIGATQLGSVQGEVVKSGTQAQITEKVMFGSADLNISSEPVIDVGGVSLRYGDQLILSGINLSIRAGEIVCVVGASGCGKTTLMRLIAGLVQPTQGHVTYRGHEMVAPRPDVAVVFQDYGKALLPWRTVVGNVALALEALRVPRSEHAGRIERLLKLTGLADHAAKFPGQLSGGMQQRLQIARCLAQDPQVLLMDEPFGALDAMTRQGLQDEMLEIVGETGATVLFVTHDLEEAIYLGDRIVALEPHPGRVGATFDVKLARPRNQLATREEPEFLRMRRELFRFVKGDSA
jgi:NitT/TauT family transport system ATP-binding protein